MNLSEFVENHCTGKQYDSCVQSPCAFASTSGCRHPLHPKNAVEPLRAVDAALPPSAEADSSLVIVPAVEFDTQPRT